MRRTILQLVATGLLAGSVTTQAAVVIDVSEVGGDVVFTSSGTLNLSGAVPITGEGSSYPDINEGIISGSTNWYYGQGGGGPVSVVRLSSYAGPFGTNESLDYLYNVGTSTGTPFAIWGASCCDGPRLMISSSFVSGSTVVGNLIFSNKSFAALGLLAGEYVYTIPNDSVTLRISSSPVVSTVPLPAAAWLLLSGVAGLGLVGRRRKAA